MKKINLIIVIMSILMLGIGVSAQKKVSTDTYLPVEEAVKLGVLPKGFPVDLFRKSLKECRGMKPYVISRNAGTGTTPSPELQTLLNQHIPNPTRGYGAGGVDSWFGDTLPLGTCKVCAAYLVTYLVDEGGQSNDTLTIWTADSSTPIYNGNTPNQPLFLYATSINSGALAGNPSVWGFGSTSSKILILDLNQAGRISEGINLFAGLPVLNNYIFTTPGTPALDVIVQDDTRVDSMYLVVWR